jgi:hypothetical protein
VPGGKLTAKNKSLKSLFTSSSLISKAPESTLRKIGPSFREISLAREEAS